VEPKGTKNEKEKPECLIKGPVGLRPIRNFHSLLFLSTGFQKVKSFSAVTQNFLRPTLHFPCHTQNSQNFKKVNLNVKRRSFFESKIFYYARQRWSSTSVPLPLANRQPAQRPRGENKTGWLHASSPSPLPGLKRTTFKRP